MCMSYASISKVNAAKKSYSNVVAGNHDAEIDWSGRSSAKGKELGLKINARHRSR
jgi:hypothetical protein